MGLAAFFRALLLIWLTIWYTRLGHDTLIVQRPYLLQIGPEMVLALAALLLFWSPRRGGRVVRADSFPRYGWSLLYGTLALTLVLLPVGFFTYHLGVGNPLSFLDYPVAKGVASFWLGQSAGQALGLWEMG